MEARAVGQNDARAGGVADEQRWHRHCVRGPAAGELAGHFFEADRQRTGNDVSAHRHINAVMGLAGNERVVKGQRVIGHAVACRAVGFDIDFIRIRFHRRRRMRCRAEAHPAK